MNDKDPMLDLAESQTWFGVRPGMTRAEVIAALKAQGVEAEAYRGNDLMAVADEWELEMFFATDGSDRVRQVSVSGETVTWKGTQLMEARLDAALEAMEPIGPAMWQAADASGEPFPEVVVSPAETVSDERLLDEGTLWLAERRMGLVLCAGEVIGVVWREARDFPTVFAGALTAEQRELTRRADLADYLRTKRRERMVVVRARDPLAPWRALVTVLALAAMAWLGREGFRTWQRWQQAEILTGKLVAMEPVPKRAFREYVFPQLRWIVPPVGTVMVNGYRVEYLDPRGKRREVMLEEGDFYVPPHEIGEEVQVGYVDGDPPEAKGPSRVRDVAFLETMPTGIVIGVLYVVAVIGIGVPRAVMRIRRRGK